LRSRLIGRSTQRYEHGIGAQAANHLEPASMKIHGYSDEGRSSGEIQPKAMAEISLVATPSELRRIASFLNKAADTMQRMGANYGHEHLSDRQPGFDDSPHFVVVGGDRSDD
jgi:hypothetical protein